MVGTTPFVRPMGADRPKRGATDLDTLDRGSGRPIVRVDNITITTGLVGTHSTPTLLRREEGVRRKDGRT